MSINTKEYCIISLHNSKLTFQQKLYSTPDTLVSSGFAASGRDRLYRARDL